MAFKEAEENDILDDNDTDDADTAINVSDRKLKHVAGDKSKSTNHLFSKKTSVSRLC